jgi:hypothetical protein
MTQWIVVLERQSVGEYNFEDGFEDLVEVEAGLDLRKLLVKLLSTGMVLGETTDILDPDELLLVTTSRGLAAIEVEPVIESITGGEAVYLMESFESHADIHLLEVTAPA